jgi:hypothetical protein
MNNWIQEKLRVYLHSITASIVSSLFMSNESGVSSSLMGVPLYENLFLKPFQLANTLNSTINPLRNDLRRMNTPDGR